MSSALVELSRTISRLEERPVLAERLSNAVKQQQGLLQPKTAAPGNIADLGSPVSALGELLRTFKNWIYRQYVRVTNYIGRVKNDKFGAPFPGSGAGSPIRLRTFLGIPLIKWMKTTSGRKLVSELDKVWKEKGSAAERTARAGHLDLKDEVKVLAALGIHKRRRGESDEKYRDRMRREIAKITGAEAATTAILSLLIAISSYGLAAVLAGL